VVQGVGYPQASDDHGRAMEIWQTARPEDPLADTGWLGRAADELFEKGSTSRAAAHAVFLGQIPIPLTVVEGTNLRSAASNRRSCFPSTGRRFAAHY